jgi:hypothetical protein
MCALSVVCIADRAVRRPKEEDRLERRPGPINPASRLPRDPVFHWRNSEALLGGRTVPPRAASERPTRHDLVAHMMHDAL